MAYLRLQEFQVPNWHWTGTTATLRIFASQAFYEATTLEYVPVGNTQNIQSACQVYNCTVVDETVNIPEVVLATTVDSNVPNATYTAILYDGNDVPQYFLLSQFFVDPSFLQSPPQYSVLVATAGTAAANGIYTYRGQFNNLPYYNLDGQSDSTTLSAIVNTGSQWRILGSGGANLYHSSFNPNFPYDSVWVNTSPSTGSLPAPNVSQDSDEVTGTWFQLTISNQAFAVIFPPSYPGPFWNVEQTKQYVNSVVGDGSTPFANRTTVGKTALSVDPVLSTFPIAYGVNDPSVSKFRGEFTLVELYALTDNIIGQWARVSDERRGLYNYNGDRWTPVNGSVIDILDFCDPDALDNTAGLQAAIDAIGGTASGGTILFPAGQTIKFTGNLDATGTKNVTFLGTNTNKYEDSNINLLYTGGGSNPIIDIASANGFGMFSMNFRYNNAAFTGSMIAAGHAASGGFGDTQRTRIEYNVMGGTFTVLNAWTIISLNLAINSLIHCNQFLYAQKGVSGRIGAGGAAYVVTVSNNEFNGVRIALWNYDTWYVTGNSFEQDNDNYVVAMDTDALGSARGLVVTGNWSGDSGQAIQPQYRFKNSYGLTVTGNWPTITGSSAFYFSGCQGVFASGNRIEGIGPDPVKVGFTIDNVTSGNYAVNIIGNSIALDDYIVEIGATSGKSFLGNESGGGSTPSKISPFLMIEGLSANSPYGDNPASITIGTVINLPDVSQDSPGGRLGMSTNYPAVSGGGPSMVDGSIIMQPRTLIANTGIALWDNLKEIFRVQANAGRFYRQWSIGVGKALTPGVTVDLDARLGNLFTLTPAQNCQINASDMIYGQLMVFRVLTSGVTPYTITFGTNFKPKGTLNTGSVTATYFDVLFESDGINFIEVSRSAGLDATIIGAGNVSSTEYGYLDGVTSAIQTQIDAKSPLVSPSFTTPNIGVATGTSLNLGGSTVLDFFTNTAALDFSSISAQTTGELTITVTGAVAGDTVQVSPNGTPESGLIWSGYVSAADTVTVRLGNVTSGAIDAASRTWRATVTKF